MVRPVPVSSLWSGASRRDVGLSISARVSAGSGEAGPRRGGEHAHLPAPLPRCHGGQSGRGQADLAIITAQQAFV